MTDISKLKSLPQQGLFDADGKLSPAGQHWINELTKLPQAVAEAAAGKELLGTSKVNTQTGTAYTLAIEDLGQIVEMNNASPNTLTIPPFADVAFPYGKDEEHARIDVAQIGAGQTTIAAGSGVTIRSADRYLKLRAQYSAATLYHRAQDEWLLAGDIDA